MDLNSVQTTAKSAVHNTVDMDKPEDSLLTASSSKSETHEEALNVSSVSENHVTAQDEADSVHSHLPSSHKSTTELSRSICPDEIDSTLDVESEDQTTVNGDQEDDDDIDSTSEISDLSDFSQESWHPVQGPIAWVQEQMRQGLSARTILEDLVPPGTVIPDDVDPIMLWRLIINIVSEPPKRKKLENINTLEDVIHLLRTSKKIIVLTGAGVSVSCGIPDFRSRDGVYARLAVDFPNLPDPQAMFDIQFFRNDPRPFFKFAKEIYPGQFKPSLCHHFIRLIESQGKLLRNYTQNIDTLEQEAGIERVIQCHGSFATATCTNCKLKVKSDNIKEDIFKQVIPVCSQCPPGTENAIMKPDIVFFGESLPEDFHKQMAADKDECDLLIVIGSSLKVRPVALIPSSLPSHVPQILINRERLHYLNFDIELLGNCDEIVSELCRRLGSGWEQFSTPGPSLTEVLLSSLPTPPISPVSQNPISEDTSLNATHGPCSTENDHSKMAVEAVNENNVNSCEENETSSSTDLTSCPGDKNLTNDAQHNQVIDSTCNDGPSVIDKPVMLSEDQPSVHVTSSSGFCENEEESIPLKPSAEEVSTRTDMTQVNPSEVDKNNAEDIEEIVSSTSSGHRHNQVHSHHNHHHHHHHHPHHHHHHHHHHKNHHHHNHHSNRKSPVKHQQKESCSDMEPVEKRAKLEQLDNEAETSNSDAEWILTSATVLDQKSTEEREDDELEEMRRMWQGRRNRVSLAQRLGENQFLFLPPSRYVFKGAEVFSDEDEDDDDDDVIEDKDDVIEDNDGNSSVDPGEPTEEQAKKEEEMPASTSTDEVSLSLDKSESLSTSKTACQAEAVPKVLSTNVNDEKEVFTANELE